MNCPRCGGDRFRRHHLPAGGHADRCALCEWPGRLRGMRQDARRVGRMGRILPALPARCLVVVASEPTATWLRRMAHLVGRPDLRISTIWAPGSGYKATFYCLDEAAPIPADKGEGKT